MADARLDILIRRATSPRRAWLTSLGGGLAALVGLVAPEPARAHDPRAKCRRKKDKRKRKSCLRRARRHNRQHQEQPPEQFPNAACFTRENTRSLLRPDLNIQRIAQTFTEPNGGRLDVVQLFFSREPDATGFLSLTVNAVDAKTRVPTDTILAATELPLAVVPTSGGLVAFSFATPARLVAGRQYALVLSRPVGGGAYIMSYESPGGCAGGALFNSVFVGSPFVPYASQGADRTFNTFVSP